jgi:hypothetical protein
MLFLTSYMGDFECISRNNIFYEVFGIQDTKSQWLSFVDFVDFVIFCTILGHFNRVPTYTNMSTV